MAERLETCTTDMTVWNRLARTGADCSKESEQGVRQLRSSDFASWGSPSAVRIDTCRRVSTLSAGLHAFWQWKACPIISPQQLQQAGTYKLFSIHE